MATKQARHSLTIVSASVGLIASLLQLAGYEVDIERLNVAANELIAIVSFGLAIYGRKRATWQIEGL